MTKEELEARAAHAAQVLLASATFKLAAGAFLTAVIGGLSGHLSVKEALLLGWGAAVSVTVRRALARLEAMGISVEVKK